jgi:hypothetical protein
MIIYQGPSMLDQSPIIAVLTGLFRKSKNAKTRGMAQLYIIRADMHPMEAKRSRADYAVCGDCKHRGATSRESSCYVVVAQAPQAIYRAFLRGKYGAAVDPSVGNAVLRAKSKTLRLGAYGDPAAVPYGVLEALVSGIKHTGYTHQWEWARMYRHLVMASVDTSAERDRATAAGWRTFRVLAPEDTQHVGEVSCPASAEMQHRTSCDRCTLCAGLSRPARDITIVAHGGNGNVAKFIALRRVA